MAKNTISLLQIVCKNKKEHFSNCQPDNLLKVYTVEHIHAQCMVHLQYHGTLTSY
jgi:hypothetical protein